MTTRRPPEASTGDPLRTPRDTTCPVCDGRDLVATHEVAEMMLGLDETFRYGECAGCGTLRILDPPEDLGRFYPPTYYSMEVQEHPRNTLHRFLRAQRMRMLLAGGGALERTLFRGRAVPTWIPWFAGRGITQRSRVCDLGSGAGGFLRDLWAAGFRDLVGVDPYLDASDTPRPGLRLIKGSIDAVQGKFDAVVVSHALEHMASPRAVLESVKRHLNPGATVVVRVPLADSFAWRQYGRWWAQLDAPRHLFVPTRRAVEQLADEVGLHVDRVIYDSTAFQMWASEQYQAGIALSSPRSYARDPSASMFTAEQIAAFARNAEQLNENEDGDSATFLLSEHDTD